MFAHEAIGPASNGTATDTAAANSRSHSHDDHATHGCNMLMGGLDLGYWGEEDETGNAPWVDRGFTASIHRMVQVDPLVLPRSELLMRMVHTRDEAYEASE